jgi:hypothetical protein
VRRTDSLRRKRGPLALVFGLLAIGGVLALPRAAGSESARALSLASVWAHWNALRGDAYELDAEERFIDDEAGAQLSCDKAGLVSYSGTSVRYQGSVRVRPEFQRRLERFEDVLAATAVEVYGRKPRRIHHYGAFNCRLSRNRKHRLSEHAFGNAIDVAGFDFGAAAKAEPLRPDLPKQLARAFRVRVADHWQPGDRVTDEIHARFLRLLTSRLEARKDVFRGMIGPSHPSHRDHFHFDMAPWRYVRL